MKYLVSKLIKEITHIAHVPSNRLLNQPIKLDYFYHAGSTCLHLQYQCIIS